MGNNEKHLRTNVQNTPRSPPSRADHKNAVQVLGLMEPCPPGDVREPPDSVASTRAPAGTGGLHSGTVAGTYARMSQQQEQEEQQQQQQRDNEEACVLFGDGSEPR